MPYSPRHLLRHIYVMYTDVLIYMMFSEHSALHQLVYTWPQWGFSTLVVRGVDSREKRLKMTDQVNDCCCLTTGDSRVWNVHTPQLSHILSLLQLKTKRRSHFKQKNKLHCAQHYYRLRIATLWICVYDLHSRQRVSRQGCPLTFVIFIEPPAAVWKYRP